MRNIRSILIMMIGLAFFCTSYAQSTSSKQEAAIPITGKPIPTFSFKVADYKKPIVSETEMKGKWYALAFWYRSCAGSVKSILKVDSMQKKMDKKMDFFLIGYNKRKALNFGEGIDSLYQRIKFRESLTVPYTFDSVMVSNWDIWEFPRIIIIDPSGVVRAITTGQDLTESKLQDLLSGKDVSFSKINSDLSVFDGYSIPDSAKELVYRSTLSKWKNESQFIPAIDVYNDYYVKTMKEPPGIRLARMPLYALFQVAYLGNWINFADDSVKDGYYPFVKLETKDSAKFQSDFITGIGFYNYEMVSPYKSSTAEIMKMMQNELCNLYNVEVTIEDHMMPVYKLIAQSGAAERLKTKRNFSSYRTDTNGDGGAGGFTKNNLSMSAFMGMLTRYIYNGTDLPYFDETGIKENIDITMDASMINRDQIIKALRKNGLDLIVGEKKMKVLVIRDAKG